MTLARTSTTPRAQRLREAAKLAALLAATPDPPSIPKGAKLITAGDCSLGCDPEFFFEQDGQVVGAEKVIGDELITSTHYGGIKNGFVMDGVQIELNPPAGHCREGLAGNIAASFRQLRDHLAKTKGIKASFTTCIELTKQELDSLSDKAKALGCAPSLNRANAKAAVTVNGATSLKRSAGGHIHLGLSAAMKKEGVRERLVDILDILVGNTCVLLDRDPNAPQRRKVYGRAGEYRLPKHGLEYRVLSNFWLRSYQLMSFVMGAARNAVSVIEHTQQLETNRNYANTAYGSSYSIYLWDAEAELLRLAGGEEGLKLFRKAINTNDYDLALANFERIWPFIDKYLSATGTGLGPMMRPHFDTLHSLIKQKGIEAFFPQDPLEHWCNVRIGGTGWESFIRNSTHVFNKVNIDRITALPNKPTLKVGAKRAS